MLNLALPNLAITPVVLGRVSIGHMEETNGKRLPVKDDHFSITSNCRRKGAFLPHPLNDEVLAKIVQEKNNQSNPSEPQKELTGIELAKQKLQRIPVTMMFNDPTINLRAEYTCFDKEKGRALCRGNGVEASRLVDGAYTKVECKAAACEFGKANNCKPYTRFIMQIEGQDDELGVFMLRTTGWNTLRSLTAKLNQIYSSTQNRLAGLPLDLVLRAKTGNYGIFYYADIKIREGMSLVQAVKVAQDRHQEWVDAGLDRDAMEMATRQSIQNGNLLEDTPEDAMSVLEEFYQLHQMNEYHEGGENTQPANALRAAIDGGSQQALEQKADLMQS